MTRVATSPSSLLDLLIDSGPLGWCGRTCPESLSIDGGRTFGAFLRMLVECGYWDRLQSFGRSIYRSTPATGVASSLSDILETGEVPQRFYLSGRGLSGYPPPRREARKDLAPTLSARAQWRWRPRNGLRSRWRSDPEYRRYIALPQCRWHGTTGL